MGGGHQAPKELALVRYRVPLLGMVYVISHLIVYLGRKDLKSNEFARALQIHN